MSRAMVATKGEAPAAKRVVTTARRIGPANDAFEQDADRVADLMMAGRAAHPAWSLTGGSAAAPVQRKCSSCGGKSAAEGDCEECRQKQTLQRKASTSAPAGSAPPIVDEVLNTPGRPLDGNTRSFFERRMGHDFSSVRIHTDTRAAASAAAVNSLAYTVGSRLVFGSGSYAPGSPQGNRLLAHELAHVVHQHGAPRAAAGLSVQPSRSPLEHEAEYAARHATAAASPATGPRLTRHALASPSIQRYGSGEHAELGETGPIVRAEVAARQLSYKIKLGDHPETVAAKFLVSLPELIAANKAELMHWDDLSRVKLQGFRPGVTITIPPSANAVTKEAMLTDEIQLTVNGVPLPYGEGIAMGDFYKTLKDMLNAPASELQELSRLIKLEKSGLPVTTEQWQKATNNRYVKLAQDNATHFSPPNAALADVSGKSTQDNKSEWEKHHETALHGSQQGKKDEALATNSFADHFLTDAFAAGHLFNRRDFTEMFESKLPKEATGATFTTASKAFFDGVATTAFVGGVQTEFSRWETVGCFSIWGDHPPAQCGGLNVHASIDKPERLSKLLQGIHMQEPSLLEGAVVKGTHDTLNTSGVEVENARGDKWDLSGDGTLNAKTLPVGSNTKTLEIARKAVAQSQMNVLGVFNMATALDLPAMFKKVWDFVPHPSAAAGQKRVKDAVTAGTDPTSPGLTRAIVSLLKENLTSIIEALRDRNILQRR